MGGQMQQSNAAAAAAALYDHPGGGSLHNAGPTSDAGDAVMARWLQSAGLQHLASPLASSGIDHRLLPNLLMQGYGAQSAEEKQKLFKLLRNLNLNGESGSEPYTPTAQSSGPVDGFYSPELRGEFGAGLLDLHAMDDTELLTEHVMPEPFEPSPFIPSDTRGSDTRGSDSDFDAVTSRQQRGQAADALNRFLTNEKETITKESNLAKIKVVVRKRPLNKKELSRKEDDVVTVYDSAYLTVHEPKLKVDLTAYVERHEFCFDAVLDEQVSNDEVYRVTVEPIIPAIFQRTKATCFAYGQTGSGKTFTMQPLPLRASEDLVRLLHHPTYRGQKFKLWLSYFEIYGGKLYDLLSDRRKLCMREDGRQQVCIVGLQEFEVSDVQLVKEFIERGNSSRSTGSTGANEESSRSHAILQLVVKKHNEVKDSRRNPNNREEVDLAKTGKVVGKISFIDLAGSERGADTTDNDRQTRIEGAEINKSLLALKECIRALDNDQIHIPFRGSKLTEVLRDSFVGNSKTVMISCISPNAGSCEHTLNTLRYADRVKSLSKSGNPKKDGFPPTVRESSSAPSLPVVEDLPDQYQEVKNVDMGKRVSEKDNFSYNSSSDYEKQQTSLSSNYPFNVREQQQQQQLQQPPSLSSSYPFNGREEGGGGTYGSSLDRERVVDSRFGFGGSTSHKPYSSSTQNSNDIVEAEKVKKVSPPRRKIIKEEKPERQTRDSSSSLPTLNYRQQQTADPNATTTVGSREYDAEPPPDGDINAILEEEEALIAAHRKEIEDTMEIVREEMKLLAEVDRPGSLIDNYVAQLSFVLSRKAASLVSLQARLARFQHRLKEQEILSRKWVPR
ncbi:Kinesin-like protein KIN-13A [Ranunculus cassubicifolius]